jgi:hypothetical protein
VTAAKHLSVEIVTNLISVTSAKGLYVTFAMRLRTVVVLEQVGIVKFAICLVVVCAIVFHFAVYVKAGTVITVYKFNSVNFVTYQNASTARQSFAVLYAILLHV